jgi:deoxyribodipyrimidine photo-lyase
MGYQVVWFKRDLRVEDHRPLAAAAERGPVLPLYIIEPEVIHAPDFSSAHWSFLRESLRELRERLRALGSPLIVRQGEALEVLRHFEIDALWAHEETGNSITYARDRRVRRWARDTKIPFVEFPANGVVRRLPRRDGWSRTWEARMAEPIMPSPLHLQSALPIVEGPIPTAKELGIFEAGLTDDQRGGENEAWETLRSFLEVRGRNYHREMSSPLSAETSCSRLSPYLAYGNLSTRQVVQATRAIAAKQEDKTIRAALRAFDARLHWRCHFMQKLEDEPRIEFENFVRAYDGMREPHWNEDYFSAWREGRTGYPMVDACMRMLHATGWVNFRMRAMLVSFASYHLWLHWREPSLYLARIFQDYEPGIHYSQFQMQSGTTGINTIRIYSPAKQREDHDPGEIFVRRWIPEYGTAAYPVPIVDHKEAVALARQRLGSFRRGGAAREEARMVMKKHGSRKGAPQRKKKAAK